MDTSLSELQAWTGRSETWRDQIGATPVKALNATLDHPAMPAEPGTPLPPLWHWLYFLPLHRQSEIGPDGHAKRGGFLPPVPLPDPPVPIPVPLPPEVTSVHGVTRSLRNAPSVPSGVGRPPRSAAPGSSSLRSRSIAA